jgi:hypothetical protein
MYKYVCFRAEAVAASYIGNLANDVAEYVDSRQKYLLVEKLVVIVE